MIASYSSIPVIAYNYSVELMVGGLILVGIGIGLFYYSSKKKQKKNQENEL